MEPVNRNDEKCKQRFGEVQLSFLYFPFDTETPKSFTYTAGKMKYDLRLLE